MIPLQEVVEQSGAGTIYIKEIKGFSTFCNRFAVGSVFSYTTSILYNIKYIYNNKTFDLWGLKRSSFLHRQILQML